MALIPDPTGSGFVDTPALPIPENAPGKVPGQTYIERGGAQPISDLFTDPWNYEPLRAQMEQLNPWVSWKASESAKHAFDEMDAGFDPVTSLKGTQYEREPERFALAKNDAHLRAMIDDIEREEVNRGLLEDAGSAANLVTGFMALAADPITYVGPGALSIGRVGLNAGRAGRAAYVGGAVGLDTTVQEGILQATQQTRTAGESAANIGGSVVLGAILGGLSKSFSKPDFDNMSAAIENEMYRADPVFMGQGGVGAERIADFSKPAAKVEGALGAQHLLFQDPLGRSLTSPLTSVREVATQLSEVPLGLTRNEDGFTTSPLGGSVETRLKTQGEAILGATWREKDDIYSNYVFGERKRAAPLRAAIGRKTGSVQAMSHTEFKEQITRAMRRNDEHNVPAVVAATKPYRKMFTDTAQRAVDEGLLPPEVLGKGGADPASFTPKVADNIWDDAGQSYVHRMYDVRKVAARAAEFKEILVRHFQKGQARAERVLAQMREHAKTGKMSDAGDKDLSDLQVFTGLSKEELMENANQVVDHILGAPAGKMVFDLPPSVGGALKSRTLRIKDELIEDFLENDIDVISTHYVRSVVPSIEMKRMFGSLDMSEQIAKINDEAHALAKKHPEQSEAILGKGGWREKGVEDLQAMAARMQGDYALPDNPMHWAPRAGRVIRSVNYLRMMGMMTPSSITDVFRPLMTQGFTNTMRDGFAPLMRSLSTANFKALAQAGDEVQLAGSALDMILDTRARAIADISSDFGRYSKFERGIDAMQRNYGVISLMAPWNSGMKQWVGAIAQANILRGAEGVLKGTADKAIIRKLAQSSIDENAAKIIAEQFAKHGSIERGVYLANTLAWDTAKPQVREALEAYRAALVREVDRTVVSPGQDKPLWMSKEWGKIAGQFRSFTFASTQRTVVAGLQERDAGVFVGMTAMIAMGGVSWYLKGTLAGRDMSAEPGDVIKNAVDQSGLALYLFDVNHFAERFTGGTIGISNAMKMAGVPTSSEPLSRYAARNWLDAIAGPTAGTLKDLQSITTGVTAAASGERMKETDIRAARRLLPFQNLFYAAWLFRAMERGVATGLDAEPAKR